MRRFWTTLLAVMTATVVSAAVLAVGALPSGAEGGARHAVIVSNQSDGGHQARAGLQVSSVGAPSVSPENLASAQASCTDCRTVAVAMQVVFLTGDIREAGPRNAAVAVNSDCTRCETLAAAYQYVLSTDGPVFLSTDGQQEVNRIRAQASSIASSDLALPDILAQLDELDAELVAVVDRELQSAGQPVSDRHRVRQVDTEAA